ncbi:MAG: hypothetical protein EZS28_032360, partial [Streblomastix strix]
GVLAARLEARYITEHETTWRLLSFMSNYRSISVKLLSIHLENEQGIQFSDGMEETANLSNKSIINQRNVKL